MSEKEPKLIVPSPEDILTPEEAELVQRADQGEFICLTCGELLLAEKVICDVYEGIILFCPDGLCGYVEL